MHYNITLIQQFNRILTRSIMYFIIFATVLIIYDQGITKPVCLLGIPVVLICFFFIERYVYHAIPYLLLHGIFFVPAILIPFPTNIYNYLYGMLLICEFFHAEYVWKHNSEKPYTSAPWEFYLLMTILCLIAKAYHYDDVVNIIFYCGILLLILHFIQFYIEGIRIILVKSRNATSVPTDKMIITSAILISFVLVVFLISSLCMKGLDLDSYVAAFGKWLGKLLLAVIKWILYIVTLIRAFFAKNRKVENLEEQKNAYENAFSDVQNGISDPSLLAKIIYGMLSIFVYGIIIYLIYQGFKQLYYIYLKRYATDQDVVTTLSHPRERVRVSKDEVTIIQKIKQRIQLDNRMKLRQIYKLSIRRHKEYHHRKSNTPKDIAKRIDQLYDEDISEITSLYEKARYSNNDISDEDVQKGGNL